MSKETLETLNNRTLIGFGDKRGNAWHYRAELQGEKSNHYPGAVPVQDVIDRIFNWEALEGTVSSTGSILTPDGVESFTITDKNRKAILRPKGAFGPEDPGAILGLFKDGYKIHGYKVWLLDTTAAILDADKSELGIGSVGLLKDGALAWVQVEVPDSIETPEGVIFRPWVTATTSLDGSTATSYKRGVTDVVCDNTHAAALREAGGSLKIRHSKYSSVKLADAHDALELVHTAGEDFAAQVADLCSVKVSEPDFDRFLNAISPLTDKGAEKTGRGLTLAKNKQEELKNLWNNDNRVTPWKGTAWGVIQAVNTHAHHVQTVRGTERAERNQNLTITGGFDKLNQETFASLEAVLA